MRRRCGSGEWWCSPWMGSLGLSTGFHFFKKKLINRDGQPTAFVKAGLTVTFPRRQMKCPPRLIIFARLR
jgi:hypothetical protein